MPAQRRATIDNDVSHTIAGMITHASRYLDPASFEVRQMARTIDKLAAADAMGASVQRAMLMHLCGDLEQALYWARNARRLKPSMAAVVDGTELVILSNLGYFSEAVKVIASMDEATQWRHTHIMRATGCWEELVALGQRVAVHDEESARMISAAATYCTVMQRIGATQIQVQEILDIAGQVLRQNQLFFLGEGPVIRHADDVILYQLEVGVGTDAAFALTDEVVTRMISQDKDAVGLAFSFLGE